MLRRRFLVNEEVAPDFIITYYAPQHIPFAGGYTGILRGFGSVTEYGNENNTVFKCVLDKWSEGVGQYGIKMLNDTHGLWYNYWASRHSELLPMDMNVGILGSYIDIIDNNLKYQMFLSNTITDVILPNEIKHLRGPLVSELLDYFNDSVVNVTLPENLESLDNNVLFTLHSLKTITIPATVNYMGHSTLNIHCDKEFLNTLAPENRSLEEIILKPYNPPQTDAYLLPIGVYDPLQFYINPNLKIRVYADCIDKYKNDSVWGQYSDLYDTINNTIVYYDMDGNRRVIEQLNDFINVSSNSKLKTATSIYLPNSVTSIGERAFSGCSSLTSIVIPDSVTSIGKRAFENSLLTSINIPNSVTSIGDNTFSGCTKLASIVIGNGVKSIGNYAFYGRKPLTSIVIPDSVENIGKYAFTYCSSLTDVTIGNSVISIGERAFSECSSLTSVIIPNSVTNISYGTFKNCSSLTSITIPSSLISIEDEAFYGCSSLTEIVIPNSVTSIGKWAFYYCESLSSIVIPDGVTSIGERTLSYSGLTSITLPNSITSIGEYALAVCTSLTSITFQGTILQWNSIVLGSNWKSGVPATVVHCTDGDIEL